MKIQKSKKRIIICILFVLFILLVSTSCQTNTPDPVGGTDVPPKTESIVPIFQGVELNEATTKKIFLKKH